MSSSRWNLVALTMLGLLVAGCAELEPVPDGADGLWRARRPGGGERVRLDVYRGPVGHRDTEHVRLHFELGEIEGLGADAFRSGETALEFRLERPAGTLMFAGTRARRPEGHFRLEPSDAFIERLEQLELNYEDRDRLLDLAIFGVSLDLVESLLALGYAGGDTGDLLRLHDYGLTPEWIASMARLGGPPSVGELLLLRNQGIQARHVDRWVAAGIADRDVDDLVRLQRYGLSATDGARYSELGFVEIDEWLSFHRNGVPESLIVAVTESTAEEKDAESIIALYVHGIDAEDVLGAAPLLAAGFDWDALLTLWRRGVPSEYAAVLIGGGWELDEDDIARLAANGLDRDWVLRVRAASGEALDVDELVELSHAGVRAAEYESYVAHGYVTVDDVVLLVNSGVDESILRRLADAGIPRPDAADVVEAVRTGLDEWIERRRP